MPDNGNGHPDTLDIRTEAFADHMADYPMPHEVAATDELPLLRCRLSDDDDDDSASFNARVLGWGSSYRAGHRGHAPGSKPPERCSGCRWTDTAILKTDGGSYVIAVMGKTIVSGETQRDTIVWTDDAEEVLRECFAPTKDRFKRDRGPKAIPPHNAVAFRQAAVWDGPLHALLQQYAELVPDVPAGAPFAA